MIRTAALVTAALTIFAASANALAPGLNLSWDDAGVSGTQDKTFACNSNSGTSTIVGSFIAPSGISKLTGAEITLDLSADGDSIPSWWEMHNVGSCRQSSLSANFTYSGSACTDYWTDTGGASGGLATYVVGYFGARSVRMTIAAAVDHNLADSLAAGTEYFCFNLLVNHAHTAGTGSCPGCSTPITIALTSVNLTQPAGVGDVLLTDTATRSYVTWQGGTTPVSKPVNVTYGQVRSLYK